jgi:hypothetical protein
VIVVRWLIRANCYHATNQGETHDDQPTLCDQWNVSLGRGATSIYTARYIYVAWGTRAVCRGAYAGGM